MALADLMAGFRTVIGGGNQNTAPNPNNQGTPGNLPASMAGQGAATLADGTTAPNGLIPAETNKDDASKSPLDAFSKLWEADANPKKADGPLFTMTPEAVAAAAATQDFRKSITKEQLTAIGKGGAEAVEAFSTAMNTVAQDAYARSAVAATKLIEAGLAKNNASLESKFAERIRSSNVSDALRTENPAFSHPAAQPLITAMEQQMLVKYPQATASEIRSMATDYVKAFASVVAPVTPTPNPNATQETDWSTFLQ